MIEGLVPSYISRMVTDLNKTRVKEMWNALSVLYIDVSSENHALAPPSFAKRRMPTVVPWTR